MAGNHGHQMGMRAEQPGHSAQKSNGSKMTVPADPTNAVSAVESRQGPGSSSVSGQDFLNTALLESLGVALYTTDADGRLTFFNEAAVELWGRRPVLGEEFWCGSWRIYWPDGSPVSLDECPMAVTIKEDGPVRGAEVIVERPDGSRRNVLPYPSPIRDSAGRLVGAVNVVVDITQRIQAEEALRESEERLTQELIATQRLQQASAQLISDGNSELVYELILDAAATIMRSDMASIQAVDEAEDALRILAWRGFDAEFGKVFELCRSDRKTSCSTARQLGHRVIVPDVETWDLVAGTPALADLGKMGIRAVQSTPLFSRSGKLLGILSTHWRQPHRPQEGDLQLLDVLARQAADLIDRSQSIEAANRFAAVVESSDDAIVTKDLQGVIKSWNRAAERLFGYSEAEAIGQSIRLIIPADRQGEEDEVLRLIGRGERIDHFETVRQRKDGTKLDISLTVSPIKDAFGRVIGASKVARDISERKAAEEFTRQSIALKDQFLGLVSHELKGPITTILGNSLLLKRHADRLDAAASQDALDDLVTDARKLHKTIDNLLLLTRLEASSDLDLEPVSLTSLACSAVETLQRSNSEREVSLEAAGDVPLVSGHPDYLTEILENLLSNAHKYSPLDCKIEVTVARTSDGHALVKVLDRGIGISKEQANELFTPFYRSDSARKITGGLGLGLALSKRLVEVQGGTIEARPREGGGAEFSFILPGLEIPAE